MGCCCSTDSDNKAKRRGDLYAVSGNASSPRKLPAWMSEIVNLDQHEKEQLLDKGHLKSLDEFLALTDEEIADIFVSEGSHDTRRARTRAEIERIRKHRAEEEQALSESTGPGLQLLDAAALAEEHSNNDDNKNNDSDLTDIRSNSQRRFQLITDAVAADMTAVQQKLDDAALELADEPGRDAIVAALHNAQSDLAVRRICKIIIRVVQFDEEVQAVYATVPMRDAMTKATKLITTNDTAGEWCAALAHLTKSNARVQRHFSDDHLLQALAHLMEDKIITSLTAVGDFAGAVFHLVNALDAPRVQAENSCLRTALVLAQRSAMTAHTTSVFSERAYRNWGSALLHLTKAPELAVHFATTDFIECFAAAIDSAIGACVVDGLWATPLLQIVSSSNETFVTKCKNNKAFMHALDKAVAAPVDLLHRAGDEKHPQVRKLREMMRIV